MGQRLSPSSAGSALAEVKPVTLDTARRTPVEGTSLNDELDVLFQLRLVGRSGAPLELASAAQSDPNPRLHELRSRLSAGTLKVVDSLLSRMVLPPVAAVEAGTCGECHLSLPTALQSSLATRVEIRRCPHCKRLLVAPRSDAPAGSSAARR
jgi:hypothetical protein